MSSLKRSWAGSLDSAIPTRKYAETLVPAPQVQGLYASAVILPRTHSLALCRATNSSFRTLQSNVPLLCIHKRRTACRLSLTVCCACADKRPWSDNNTVRPVDVPENGPVQIASRAEH
ncbi:hypothetical protein BDU57DRAFT_529708 [Ampelomyces quisqualis]|uniref:Uncharacterized protein n=1 Tax=Ampelomyces quisqualis TaxID=50730 RepID=A0A6A5QM60_AMPQU|nr:hypothetical protein BDU57DRAFT_529708 [Ampelomyces quisqualis]